MLGLYISPGADLVLVGQISASGDLSSPPRPVCTIRRRDPKMTDAAEFPAQITRNENPEGFIIPGDLNRTHA